MATLDDRVAALEQELAQLQSAAIADTITPNYLTVNPDGTVSANFTGHVAAEGLDLPAGTTQTAPSDSRVRWLRQSDGAVIADLVAFNTGNNGNSAAIAATYAEPDSTISTLLAQAVDEQGVNRVALQLLYDAGQSPPGGIYAVAGDIVESDGDVQRADHTTLILDEEGQSNFPQLAFTTRSLLSYGAVVTGAGNYGPNTSGDWTAQAYGTYGTLVTFITPKRDQYYTVVTTPFGTGGFPGAYVSSVNVVSSSQFIVATYASSTGASAGGVGVTFIAIG